MATDGLFQGGAYRDRAKERRDKYGTDAIVPGWKKRYERELAKSGTGMADDDVGPQPQRLVEYSVVYYYPCSSESEINEENVGNKMMKVILLACYMFTVVQNYV